MNATKIRNYNNARIYDISKHLKNNITETEESINELSNTVKIPSGSTRPTLTASDAGYLFLDTDTNDIVCWTGTKWNDE